MCKSLSRAVEVASAEAMRELGSTFGKLLLRSGAGALCIAIEGELGAGKTTFVGGVMAAAGIAGPIRSPTYTLIEPYEAAGRQIYHVDLYRLIQADEVEALGVRDLLTPSSILLIEWPSRAAKRIPPADIRIDMAYAPAPQAGRQVQFAAGSPAGTELLKQFLR